MNNLYGSVETMPMPHSDFKFLDEEEIEAFNINDYDFENERGYIIECDVSKKIKVKVYCFFF